MLLHPSASSWSSTSLCQLLSCLSHPVNNPNTQKNNPSPQRDAAYPLPGITELDIFCRSCQWTWYVFPIVPPPLIQLHETQTCSVHGPRCWSMTTHDFPSWHRQVRSSYSWVGTVLKNGLCFPTHPSKPQWKRQTRNLFTPSGSSSRFSREAAHLAVLLLGFWWLLLELPSPSWMSAKQSLDCVCDP